MLFGDGLADIFICWCNLGDSKIAIYWPNHPKNQPLWFIQTKKFFWRYFKYISLILCSGKVFAGRSKFSQVKSKKVANFCHLVRKSLYSPNWGSGFKHFGSGFLIQNILMSICHQQLILGRCKEPYQDSLQKNSFFGLINQIC